MKKLITSLALLSLFGSSNILASDIADGFNWPDGFSSSHVVHQLQSPDYSGFNWPEGRIFENDASTISHANVAEGFNWPEDH